MNSEKEIEEQGAYELQERERGEDVSFRHARFGWQVFRWRCPRGIRRETMFIARGEAWIKGRLGC